MTATAVSLAARRPRIGAMITAVHLLASGNRFSLLNFAVAASPSAANAKLEKAVKSMFATDEQVRRADLSVRADVTKNEVTLSGTVESEAVRSRAVELAKTAHVGVVVNDKMTINPRRSNTMQ